MSDDEKNPNVHHPAHYQSRSGIEVIDVIEAFGLGFHLGSVVKYVLREGKKDDPIQDLEKAAWYLAREIENRKKRKAASEERPNDSSLADRELVDRALARIDVHVSAGASAGWFSVSRSDTVSTLISKVGTALRLPVPANMFPHEAWQLRRRSGGPGSSHYVIETISGTLDYVGICNNDELELVLRGG